MRKRQTCTVINFISNTSQRTELHSTKGCKTK